MTSNTESHRAIEISREIKLSMDVNDHGGMFESYVCTIYTADSAKCVYIHVDHRVRHTTLLKFRRFTSDTVAILKGDTKTLEQLDIQSHDGTILGRLHQNTVVSAVSNSPILEFVLQPGKDGDEAIIGDPRTKDTLAHLRSSDPSDPTELTTIIYNSETCISMVTKTLILLLAYKTFKDKACPKLKIPAINYHGLDELANIQNIAISKALHRRESNIHYSYFDVMVATTNQKLLTFMIRSEGTDGCRLEVFNLQDRRLFTAAPLVKFNVVTKLYMNETIEIGEVVSYKLYAKSLKAKYNAELKADAIKLDNEPNRHFRVFRWITHQTIATITPDYSTSPRRVMMDIYPVVDTMHKALLLTLAVKIIFNLYGFHCDAPSQKRCLPQNLTGPTVPKQAKHSLTTEPIEYSLASHTPEAIHMRPQQPIVIGSPSTRGNQPHHSWVQPQTTAWYSGQPPYTTQQTYADQRQSGNRQPHLTQHAYAGQSYQGYQTTHYGQGADAGQNYHGYQAAYFKQRAYGGHIGSNYQPPYSGQTTSADQRYHGYQATYSGQGADTVQRHPDNNLLNLAEQAQAYALRRNHENQLHVQYTTPQAYDGQRDQGYQSTNTGVDAYAGQKPPLNQ